METSKELGQLMRSDGKEHWDLDEKDDDKSREKEDTAGTRKMQHLKRFLGNTTM